MLRIVEELDTPDGYKAEPIREKIVVSPRSQLRYLRPMRRLHAQFEAHAPDGHVTETSPFLFVFPPAERGFGPDLFVADESAFDAEGRHANAFPRAVELDTYGRIVPVYLALDMQVQEVSVFWDPSPKGYRSRTNVPFGRPVQVPAPFNFELGTAEFIRRAPEAEPEADSGHTPVRPTG